MYVYYNRWTFRSDGRNCGKNKFRGRDGREIGATSLIIVANRAWIMTRERTPNDKSRAERHARQTKGRIGRDSVRARFSLSSRLADGDVKLCTIRRGPLSISVYVMFVSRNWPNCRTCLSRLCGCWVLRRVLRATAMTAIFLHCYRREFSRARPMWLTVTNGIDDDLFGEQITIESSPDNSTDSL